MQQPHSRPLSERDRLELQLRLTSPKRAQSGRAPALQADADHLPLFIAADEPPLI